MFPVLKKLPPVEIDPRKEPAPVVIVEPYIYSDPITVKRASRGDEEMKLDRAFTYIVLNMDIPYAEKVEFTTTARVTAVPDEMRP
jgi:hypothetical protein